MKTKIIYISGNEVFDAADIRAAFEEVRNALGLSHDTVLFGVPVDSDDAGLYTAPATENITIAPEISIDVPESTTEETPVKKTRKTTTTKVKKVIETETPVAETIVPILSILSSKTDEVEAEPEHITTETISLEQVTDTVTITDTEITETVTTQTVTISDITNDDEPASNIEKTLEQLLETMAPLREDHGDAPTIKIEIDSTDSDTDDNADTNSDTDATLEKLANEFAQKQDTIITEPKIETNGKIGKLKNILPFKKAKREDSSLMGDLFGWAGIAANDDEFSIPGFFTTASKK